MDSTNKVLLAIGVIAVIGASTVTGYVLSKNDNIKPAQNTTTVQTATTDQPDTNTQAAQSAAPETPVQSNQPSTSYNNGTYTATKSYRVPEGGTNTITATVSISDDKISSVQTQNDYVHHESERYTSSFASQISSEASGQPITTSYSRVAGASLTTEAFNQALGDIANQAKV